jgi:hypothetical protein
VEMICGLCALITPNVTSGVTSGGHAGGFPVPKAFSHILLLEKNHLGVRVGVRTTVMAKVRG